MPKAPIVSIVDDDRDARDAIETLVRSLGYATISFPSAEDFLNSGRIEEVACLITDIQMAGKTGLELHQQLLADGHQIPVIFVSAFPERFADKVAKARATGFLAKPFRDESLMECLESALT